MSNLHLYCYSCMSRLPEPDGLCPHCGHDNHIRRADPDCLPAMELGGQYYVGKPLGRGGFGVTYLALDKNLERVVALKEYYPVSMATRETYSSTLRFRTESADVYRQGCARALEEGKLAARMGHMPGVVQIHNAFEANGTVYIVMEYIQGKTLMQLMQERGGKLPWAQVITLMEPLMRTLSAIHGMKVIHRDVSPDNVMIRDADGSAVLLDFGAAHTISDRTMSEHSISLRHGYAPVEQYTTMGKQDGRIDEYALCATMYHALTGKRPADATERAFAGTELASPRSLGSDIPAHAEAALMKGLALKAENRFEDVETLRQALLGKKAPARTTRAQRQAKRKRKPLLAILAAVVCIAAAAGAFLLSGQPQQPAPAVTATPTAEAVPTVEDLTASTSTEAPTEAPTMVPATATPVPPAAKVPVYLMAGNTLLDEKTALLQPGQPLTLSPLEYIPAGYEPVSTESVTVVMKDDGSADPPYVRFSYVTPTPSPSPTASPTPTASPAPTPSPAPTAEPAPSADLASAQVGDCVTFGSYEQDADAATGKESIEWLVLDRQGDRLLVISRYGLDCKPYNSERTDVTWETCTLRTWLNTDFLNAAFSSSEQAKIPAVTVSADRNPTYNTDPGNATRDKVFLLSIPEANQYFASDSARLCKPTAYAQKQGAYTLGSGDGAWWLRSPALWQNSAAYVSTGGSVLENGSIVSDSSASVRPAMWISLGTASSAEEDAYNAALALLNDGRFEAAAEAFEALGDYQDSREQAKAARYELACDYLRAGDTRRALLNYRKARDYQGANSLARQLADLYEGKISAGSDYTAAVKSSGKVELAGNTSGYRNAKNWTRMAAVSCAGTGGISGLRTDGTAAVAGFNSASQKAVAKWTDLVALCNEGSHVIGLKADGTAVSAINKDVFYASYQHSEYTWCNVEGWRDIVAIATGDYHTVGLKADGTVVAAGPNNYGECSVEGWTDIVDVAAGMDITVGLRSDGTVVAAGDNRYGRCNVSDWTDIAAIAVNGGNTVGLRADGTVVITGVLNNAEQSVAAWRDVVAVYALNGWIAAIHADGTVSAFGNNEYGQCDVSGWTDIVALAGGYEHTVGLRADGTVVAAGNNKSGQCKVSNWNLGDLPRMAAPPALVTLGSYEQDGNTANGKEPIEWLVLDRQGDRALVISRYGLESMVYNENYQTAVTWEMCDARRWLNNDFLSIAFTGQEQQRILTTTVPADKNPDHNINPGNDTQDKVFLLSIPEAQRYFASDSDRHCEPTAYIKSMWWWREGRDDPEWWLRTPGLDASFAAQVYQGSINTTGTLTSNFEGMLRPAMWISLGAENVGSGDSAGQSVSGEAAVMLSSCTDVYVGDNDLARFAVNGRYGYFNIKTGAVVIQPQWSEAYPFSEGLAGVKQSDKWGFIDVTGKVVIQPQWDSVLNFSEGLSRVEKNGQYGYIDVAGKVVINPQWDSAGSFSEGLAYVQQNGHFGYIDATGKIVIDLRWDGAGSFSDGLGLLSTNGKWCHIDVTGKIVSEWHDAWSFSEGLASVESNGKWGYIDTTGKVVIEPQWDYTWRFSEGLAGVKRDDKYGYIDTAGKVVIQPQWDDAGNFSEGLVRVEKNGKQGYIDTAGNVVIQPQWDDAGFFSNGLARVGKDDKWGLIDTTGKVVIGFGVTPVFPLN